MDLSDLLPIVLAAEDGGSITLPWQLLTAIGAAIVTAFGWLAKLALNTQKKNQEVYDRLHAEVVELTRESTSALTDNTAALREMAKSLDSLAQAIQQSKE